MSDFDFKPHRSDVRGELFRHKIQDQQYKSVFTVANNYRAGETHPHDKHVVIVRGIMKLTQRLDGKDVESVMPNNQVLTIHAGTPHLFFSETDTILIEWWPGEFDMELYPPYRQHNNKSDIQTND